MTYHRDELSRFSANGKTFFLNRATARTDTDYLVINALYGKGQKERLILFPSQYLEFHSHLTDAIEKLAGISFGPGAHPPTPAPPALPRDCPNCSHGSASWEVLHYNDTEWFIQCQCGNVVFHTPGCPIESN